MDGVVAILGNAETVADNLGGALQFLATGPGVLSAVSGGVLLILWALVTQSPENDSSPQAVATLDSTSGKEIERLNKEIERRDRKIRAIAEDYEELLAKLSDPTAERQRQERTARERCIEVSDEVFMFLKDRPFVDPAESVAAFEQRQQWKVDDVRDRMDKQGLLTQRERDILTFRSGDQLDKIEAIVEVLSRLGQGG